MKKLQGLLDRIPHWLFVGLALMAGVFWQNLRDQPDFLSAITTWDTKNIGKDVQMALGVTLTAFIAWLRTDPWTAAANASNAKIAAAAKAPPLPLLVLLLPLLLLSGCLTSSPTVPVTPSNQNQIATCQSTASFHNGIVIGDMVVGGGSTIAGTVAALPSVVGTPKDTLIAGAAIGAGVTTIGAGVAALTASNFANGHCTDVVAPLPMKPPPSQAKILPSFSELRDPEVLQ